MWRGRYDCDSLAHGIAVSGPLLEVLRLGAAAIKESFVAKGASCRYSTVCKKLRVFWSGIKIFDNVNEKSSGVGNVTCKIGGRVK